VRGFHNDALFLSLSNTSSAGTCHPREEFILGFREVDFESVIHAMLKVEPVKIIHSQIAIHHLKMNTSQFLKCEVD